MTIKELMVALGYKVDDKSKSKVLNDANALKKQVKSLLGTIGLTVSVAGIIQFGKDSAQAASDVEQMEQKFNVVFDNLSKEADSWAANFADSIGRSKNSIKTYLADQQNLLVGFGMARSEAMKMSQQLTTAAIDLASFSNLNENDAINAMTKAVMGESEAAKSLGAVLNEQTRALAMQSLGLSGTYDKLDQLTKMQVNYEAIMQQSKDSIGDAARSMGSYESNSRKSAAILKDIKELAGKFLLPYLNKGKEMLIQVTSKIRDGLDALGEVNEEGTVANQIWNKFLYYGEKGKVILDKVVGAGKKVIDFLGGSKNALKLLTTIIGAVLAYKAGMKILTFVKGLESVSKVLSMINVKALLVIGVIVLLVLLVQDFIYFLQGKDSLFGTLLEKAGVDVDATREKFLSFKDDIAQILGYIKELCAPAFEDLKEFWEKYGPTIMAYAQNLFNGIIQGIAFMVAAIEPFLSVIVNLVKALFALLSGDTEGALSALKEAWSSFGEFCSAMWDSLIAILDGLFGGLPSKALEWGKDMLQNFIDGITEKIAALKEKITSVGNVIKEKLHFSKPDNGPLADADTWTPDMMDLFMQGIESGKEKLKNTVLGVASIIKGVVTGDTGTGLAALAGSQEATAQTIGGMTNHSSNYNIVQNNNFNNTFNGGDREMQGQASRQMNRDAHDATTYLAHAVALGR